MCQTDVWADVSQLDALRAGTHLPLKQLQSPRVEQEMAKGHSKKRDPFPAQEMHGLPGESKAVVPKDRSDEVLLILLFSPPGSEAR